MRSFEYRQPRRMTHFDVEFVVEGHLHCGVCTDVSDGGMKAEFSRPVAVGSLGSITLHHPKQRFELEAIVAHLEGEQAGLSFICRTPEDHLQSEQLVSAALALD